MFYAAGFDVLPDGIAQMFYMQCILPAGVGKQEREETKKALRTPIRGTGSGSPPAHSRRPPPAVHRLAGTLHPADGSRTGEAQRRGRHAVRRGRHASPGVLVRWRWRGVNDLAGLDLLDEDP